MTGQFISDEQHNELLDCDLEDYADIWAELAAWDALSDEAWELVYRRGYATPTRLSVTNCDN